MRKIGFYIPLALHIFFLQPEIEPSLSLTHKLQFISLFSFGYLFINLSNISPIKRNIESNIISKHVSTICFKNIDVLPHSPEMYIFSIFMMNILKHIESWKNNSKNTHVLDMKFQHLLIFYCLRILSFSHYYLALSLHTHTGNIYIEVKLQASSWHLPLNISTSIHPRNNISYITSI